MNEETTVLLRDKSANPAPLGLFAFGTTTVLLNLHNAGFYDLDAMILAIGLCYGGLTQVIAGIMEARKGNSFGFTAFLSYGFFWISLVVMLVLPKLGWTTAASKESLGAYMFLWGIITTLLFIGTLRLSRALQFVFGTLLLLFFLLAASLWSGMAEIERIAGFEGVLCGAIAIYTAAGILINEVYGRTVWPLGAKG